MTIKLEKIYTEDSDEITYKIRKSFIFSLTLTENELRKLYDLILKELITKYKGVNWKDKKKFPKLEEE